MPQSGCTVPKTRRPIGTFSLVLSVSQGVGLLALRGPPLVVGGCPQESRRAESAVLGARAAHPEADVGEGSTRRHTAQASQERWPWLPRADDEGENYAACSLTSARIQER